MSNFVAARQRIVDRARGLGTKRKEFSDTLKGIKAIKFAIRAKC